MKLRLLVFLCLGAVAHGESFESAPAGPFTSLKSDIGMWSAEAGNTRIQGGHGKSGKQSLRITGDGERSAVLTLSSPTVEGAELTLSAERWTRQEPFSFRIDAKGSGDWKEIHNADKEIQVGGFKANLRVPVSAGTTALRFRCTAPAETGVLIDDIEIQPPLPAKVTMVEVVQPVAPAFIRESFNPVLGFRVVVEGNIGKTMLEAIEFGFGGTTRMQDIASFRIIAGETDPAVRSDQVVAEGNQIGDKISLATDYELKRGDNWFWVSPVLKDDASLDGRIDASVFRIKAGGAVLEPANPSPDGSQRVGYAVRLPGDDGSKSYRIPGMALSKAGTLIAVYDIRYNHAGDLPADIDVGVSRSTDGGQSWGKMIVAMDMGNDPKFGYDGVGDPAVLVDPSNGRIWISALWSHGNRGWNGSEPGMKPEETGQFMLAYSDDDGKTWSKPINITDQVKNPEWRLFFNGPGAGIAMKDGTLAFAAQFRAADGKPWSTMVSSKDHGKTWEVGTGVKSDTTEAQIAQLADGSIMINCRDNRGGSRTIAVTNDLGKTWTLHPTDRKALREPVCMASLRATDDPKHGELLWFSNPDTTGGRRSMTIKLSTDQGMTWPEKDAVLYDSRNCMGYSCLAPVDAHHVGVLYEGQSTMYFLRFPVNEWLK